MVFCVYYFYSFNIILCNILLVNDRKQAIPAESGTIIKPIPVLDYVTDVVVESLITTVSTYSNFEIHVLYLFILFFNF